MQKPPIQKWIKSDQQSQSTRWRRIKAL